jgi:hypothetical protein
LQVGYSVEDILLLRAAQEVATFIGGLMQFVAPLQAATLSLLADKLDQILHSRLAFPGLDGEVEALKRVVVAFLIVFQGSFLQNGD